MRDREVDFSRESPASKIAAVRRIIEKTPVGLNNPSDRAILARALPPVSHEDHFHLAVLTWLTSNKRPRGQRGRDQREHPIDRSGWVYFVGAGDRIKIGTTSNVRKRFGALRTASPVPLDLLLAIPGSRDLETRLHRKFDELHSHGEWFRAEPSLLRYIDRLRNRQARRAA